MMGLAQYTADVPVVKGTSGILVLRHDPETRKGPPLRQVRQLRGRLPDGPGAPQARAVAERGAFADDRVWGVNGLHRVRGLRVRVLVATGPLVQLIKYAKWNLAQKTADRSERRTWP